MRLHCIKNVQPCTNICVTEYAVFQHSVKPVKKGHSKIDKTKILITNGSLMKVESIAECSP